MEHPRYPLFDTLRGISIASMVLYHLMYNLRELYGIVPPGYSMRFDHIWQQTICWSFILLSGACRVLSQHSFRRGLTLVGCGLLISVITMLALPSQSIHFGILTFTGCATLLFCALRGALSRCPALAGTIGCFFLFWLTYSVPRGLIGFGAALPRALYQFSFGYPFGFPAPDFYSADYFPLIPWVFLYFAGYFLFRLVRDARPVQRALRLRLPVAEALGRQSLTVYMLHQPVLFGVLLLLPLR